VQAAGHTAHSYFSAPPPARTSVRLVPQRSLFEVCTLFKAQHSSSSASHLCVQWHGVSTKKWG
jgi:hypothetical protein